MFRTRSSPGETGGVLAYLPLVLMVVLMPLIAWLVIGYLEPKPEKTEEPAKIKKVKKIGAPSNMAVPVIDGVLGFVKGNPRNGISPIITNTNAIAANISDLGDITVTLADTKSAHNAVIQIYVVGDDTDEIIRRINETIVKAIARNDRTTFFDQVTKLLSSKFIKDTFEPSFKNILRGEIKALCDQVLGTNVVREVVITKFLSK